MMKAFTFKNGLQRYKISLAKCKSNFL
jgi:hypothetical protein